MKRVMIWAALAAGIVSVLVWSIGPSWEGSPSVARGLGRGPGLESESVDAVPAAENKAVDQRVPVPSVEEVAVAPSKPATAVRPRARLWVLARGPGKEPCSGAVVELASKTSPAGWRTVPRSRTPRRLVVPRATACEGVTPPSRPPALLQEPNG